jgi:hypothetical protein
MQIDTLLDIAAGKEPEQASTAVNARPRDFRSFANEVSKGFPTIKEFEKEQAKKQKRSLGGSVRPSKKMYESEDLSRFEQDP